MHKSNLLKKCRAMKFIGWWISMTTVHHHDLRPEVWKMSFLIKQFLIEHCWAAVQFKKKVEEERWRQRFTLFQTVALQSSQHLSDHWLATLVSVTGSVRRCYRTPTHPHTCTRWPFSKHYDDHLVSSPVVLCLLFSTFNLQQQLSPKSVSQLDNLLIWWKLFMMKSSICKQEMN